MTTVLAGLAVMLLVAGGIALLPRRRRVVAVVVVIGLYAVVVTQPAPASFDANNGSHPTITAPLHFGASTIATPTSLSCAWTGATSVQANWNTTSSWAGAEVQRNTNGGSYADYAAVSAGTTNSTDASATSPTSNTYGYQVYGTSGTNWRSSTTSPVLSTSCVGTISTVATALGSANLRAPDAMTMDSSGNVFVADSGNNCIREVTAATGLISTVAGTCSTTGGHAGDGSAATSATLNDPEAITIDQGTIYVADTANSAIRSFTVGGNINTVVGQNNTGGFIDNTAPTSAKLDHADGIAFDSSHNMYIADKLNCRVRQVLYSGGSFTTIQTIAGTGTCSDNGVSGAGAAANTFRLFNPKGLAIDSHGYVYVADKSNQRVRQLQCAASCTTATNWHSFEIAGTGSSGSTGDGGQAGSAKVSSPFGLAFDSSNNLYIGDSGNNVVRVITASGGVVSSTSTINTYAGSGAGGYTGEGYPKTASGINSPDGVFIDTNNIVYVADTGHHMIRKITANGNIVAVAGNGTAGSGGDGTAAATAAIVGISLSVADTSSNIYFSDPGDFRIRKYFPTTGEVATIAGTGVSGITGDGSAAILAKVQTPQGIAIDGAGNVYFADSTNNKVRKIDTVGNISTVVGNGTGGNCVNGTAASSACIDAPYGIAFDSAGNLFIVDGGANCQVHEVLASNSNIYKVYNSGGGCGSGAGQLNLPQGLAISGTTLYVGDTTNNKVVQLTCTANCATSGTSPATFSGSVIAGTGTASFSGDGGAATSATLFADKGVAAFGSSVYVGDSGNTRVRKISGGNISTVAGKTSTGNAGDNGPATAGTATLTAPSGIAADASGNVYISSSTSLRKVIGPP